jgi:translation elongation factor EF-Tu-like GTPase
MVKAADAYVKAKLTLYPENEGGRTHYILTGFRPNHVFEYVESQILATYIGEIQFDASEKVEPGEEKEVSVRFLMTPKLKNFLQVGRKWWLHEGARKIGEAIVLQYNCP